MGRNRFFAFLTALCLLVSLVPIRSYASQPEGLDSLLHARQRQEATRELREGPLGDYYVSDKSQAVLPAGNEEYIVSGVLDNVCQWGIAEDGYLYIWCDGDMPSRSSAEEYPWYAYSELFSYAYIDAGSVSSNAFRDYDNLEVVEFEASLKSIGERAFSSCNRLVQIWFYGNAPTIAGNAFSGVEADLICHYGDTSWDSIWGYTFGGTLEWYQWVDTLYSGMYGSIEWAVYEDLSMVLYGVGGPMQSQDTAEAYPWSSYADRLTYIQIEYVTQIGDYAFMGCRNVQGISWDSYLTAIGDYAFSYIGIDYLQLTGNVTRVGSYAFAGCGSIDTVEIGKNVTEIGEKAFADCTGLRSIRFAGDPPAIGTNAFHNVTAEVTYPYRDAWDESQFLDYGGKLSWKLDVYEIDSGWMNGFYWSITNTGTLTLAGTRNTMSDLEDAFLYPWSQYAQSITAIACTGVTHLGSHCFANLTALKQAEFDEALSSIGDGAFQGCSGFTLSFAGDAPTLGNQVFSVTDFGLEYPQGNATWTQAVIDRFRGYKQGENELPPVDILPDDELTDVSCGMTAQQVYDAMIALQPQYPEGMRWTNDNYYAWKGGYFSGGYGCAGFAFILSDAAFGTEPARIIDGDITIADIRVGDILRINNDTHSVIVLEVYDDHVVIAEGNYNSSIHWGRTLSASTIASTTDYIMTRYPEHSWGSVSCLESRTCSKCGAQGEAPGHSWLDASCTAPRTCSVCGVTEGSPAGHSWQDATCGKPQTCSVCGLTQGSATGQHVFTDSADNDCDVCGYRRDVGTELPDDVFDPFSEFELEVLRLTNIERVSQGLNPLTTTEALQRATDIRAEEVLAYFDHTRPNGTSCFTILEELNIPYSAAAENIAKGYQTPASVVNGWMNSEGHRRNILTPSLGHMGVGETGRAWVQLFTNAPAYSSIRVDVPEGITFETGTAIDDMGLVAVLRNANGNCWLPLADAYCSGYDPNLSGSQTVTVSVLGVTCTFTVTVGAHQHTWVEATCEAPRTCSSCGKAEGAALGHTWTDADCENPKTCSACGKTDGSALGHTWNKADCENPKTCSVCGKTEGSALGHDWDIATCEEPRACSRCGIVTDPALGHTWTDATCEAPKTCQVCGVPEGDALGHDWNAATCEMPKTCARCTKTSGEPLGHSWQDATCEAPKTCSVCGKTEGSALGHSWAEATCEVPKTCTLCGKTEGNVTAHSWDGGTVTQAPTNDDAGVKTFTCVHCGTTKTEAVPNLLYPFVKADKADTLGGRYTVWNVEDGAVVSLDYEIPENGATVLIFFSHVCGNSQYLMESLNRCDWMANPYLNVVAVECISGSTDAVKAFRETYTPNAADHIRYLCADSGNAAFSYFYTFANGNSLTWPLVLVLTDSDQGPMIRYGAEAMTSPEALRETLEHVSSAFAGWDGSEHAHVWADATCEVPKTCTQCGASEGEALGHSWSDATCDTPMTCQRCDKTEGAALGHSWSDATCEAPKTCTRCAKTDGSPLDHSFAGGKCTMCGISELVHGDADGDGEVTYLDAMRVLQCAVGLMTPDEAVSDACDVDNDGFVTYLDAMMILQFAVGLILEFPAKP